MGANFEKGATLTCFRTKVGHWETFRVETVDGSGGVRGLPFGTEVTLAVFSKHQPSERWWFLQYRKDSSKKVRADRKKAQAWEEFVVVDPSEPH
ncbi:MAG: hypothetical protein AAGG08_15440 [Actinomycetota bacterium]